MLTTIEIETAAKPDATVIWLHGLGANGHDFEPLVPEIVRPGQRAWRFVFPNAPSRQITVNGGMRMPAWYDIQGLDRRSVEDERGFRDTDAQIRELIAREAQRGITASRVVLAGFSQGGAVALYTAPRYPLRLAGVMVLSSYLPLANRLLADKDAANDATPIFMAHGLQDPVLPVAMGSESRDILRGLGFGVEWHQYPMAHSVCAAEVTDIRDYLFRVLP